MKPTYEALEEECNLERKMRELAEHERDTLRTQARQIHIVCTADPGDGDWPAQSNCTPLEDARGLRKHRDDLLATNTRLVKTIQEATGCDYCADRNDAVEALAKRMRDAEARLGPAVRELDTIRENVRQIAVDRDEARHALADIVQLGRHIGPGVTLDPVELVKNLVRRLQEEIREASDFRLLVASLERQLEAAQSQPPPAALPPHTKAWLAKKARQDLKEARRALAEAKRVANYKHERATDKSEYAWAWKDDAAEAKREVKKYERRVEALLAVVAELETP